MSKKGPGLCRTCLLSLLTQTYGGGFLNPRSEELEHKKFRRNIPFQLQLKEAILSPFRFLFPLGETVGPRTSWPPSLHLLKALF